VKIQPNVVTLISSDDRLATAVAANTNNPVLAIAALRSGALDDEMQFRAAGIVMEQMRAMFTLLLAERSDRYSPLTYSTRECLRELTEVFGSNQLCAQTVELISASSGLLNETVENHPNFSEWVAAFLRVADTTTETFVVAARTATDSETLDNIVQTIGNDRSKYSSPSATMCAVAQNEHCTAAIIRKMFDLRIVHWGIVRSMVTTVTNRSSLAALILWSPWFEVDRVLTKTGDPERTLTEVLEIACAYDAPIHPDILKSKYMGRDMISKLPIQSFFPTNCSPEMTSQLAAMLTESINDTATWEVLETVGKEFTGSVDDLLKIAAAV